MKRLPIRTAAAAMLLALAGCGPTTTPNSDAAGHPSVGVTTRSVVTSGASPSPSPTVTSSASPSPRPSAPPTHPHTAAPTHASGSTRRSGTSGGSSTGGSATGGSGSAGSTVIKSPSGNYYHAGEFCPHADDGLSTVDSHGNRIICSEVNGYFRWHY